MSEMRKLLESISNFSVADPKAPDGKTEPKEELSLEEEELEEQLMQEYKYYVSEADPPPAGQPQSPVADINPPGTGNPATPGTPATNTATSQTGAAPQPGTAAAGAQTQAPKPGAPAPAGGDSPTAPRSRVRGRSGRRSRWWPRCPHWRWRGCR